MQNLEKNSFPIPRSGSFRSGIGIQGQQSTPVQAFPGPALGPIKPIVLLAISSVMVALTGCQVTKQAAWLFPSAVSGKDQTLSLKENLKLGKERPSKEAARLMLTVADEELQAGLEKEAQAHYEQTRRLDPTVKGISHRLALIHDSRGEHGLAQSEYDKAMRETPKNADLLNDLGYSYYSQGDWKKAEDCYRKAIAIHEDPRYLNNLGLALGQQSRYREALESFRKATDEARANGNLGFIFLTQGRIEHARRAYQQALELDPGYELARRVLGQMDQEQKGNATPSRAEEPLSARSDPYSAEPITTSPR